MTASFPPPGVVWPQQHPPHQHQHYGQHPGGTPLWWGAPNDIQGLRADVAAAQIAARGAQIHAQQTGTAMPRDMLGRIDRIEGAMEALLQRLNDQQVPLGVKQPPPPADQTSGNRQ